MSIRDLKSPFFDIKDEDGMEFVDIGPGIDYIPVNKKQIVLRISGRRFKSITDAFNKIAEEALSFKFWESPSEKILDECVRHANSGYILTPEEMEWLKHEKLKQGVELTYDAEKPWSADDQEVIDNMSKALEEVNDGQKEMFRR